MVANVPFLMDLYNGGGYNYYRNVMYPYVAKYAWTFGGMALFVTTWITTLLTIHRYVVLQFPFSDKTKKLTSFRSTMSQVVCITVVGVAYYTPQFFSYDIVTGRDEENRTSVELHYTALLYNKAYKIYSAVSFLILGVLVPMIISSILTYKIMQLLMRAKAVRANMVSTAGNSSMERGISVALVSVVIIFIVCEMPNVIVSFVLVIYPEHLLVCEDRFLVLSFTAVLTMTLNSSINVFVYGLCSSEFRKQLQRWLKIGFLCCSCRSKDSQKHAEQTPNGKKTPITTVPERANEAENTHM